MSSGAYLLADCANAAVMLHGEDSSNKEFAPERFAIGRTARPIKGSVAKFEIQRELGILA